MNSTGDIYGQNDVATYGALEKALTGADSAEEAEILLAVNGKTVRELFDEWAAELGFGGLNPDLMYPDAGKGDGAVQSQ